jgi:hypothetical protein
MCRDYIARHNLIADRLEEAIKLNCNYEGSIYYSNKSRLQMQSVSISNPSIYHLGQTFGTGWMKQLKILFLNSKEFYTW